MVGVWWYERSRVNGGAGRSAVQGLVDVLWYSWHECPFGGALGLCSVAMASKLSTGLRALAYEVQATWDPVVIRCGDCISAYLHVCKQ